MEEQFLNIENRATSGIALEDYIEDLKYNTKIINIGDGIYGFRDSQGRTKVDKFGKPIKLVYNRVYDEAKGHIN